MRIVFGKVGMWPVIERRHHPLQERHRRGAPNILRPDILVESVEKWRQRRLHELDRNASVPDALRQAPSKILEGFAPRPNCKMHTDVLSQFPKQRQCPRYGDGCQLHIGC
jgi:hypothetical protein